MDEKTFTVTDIVKAAKKYIKENGSKIKESILYFVSELTEINIEALMKE